MTKLRLDISTSLDGFVAGPNRTVEQPLGDGGMQLHEWIFGLASWMESHGVEGEGATGATTTSSGSSSPSPARC